MAILGAHMSIAGGFDRAVQRGRTAGCDCIQIFTSSNSQWKARPVSSLAARAFREALVQLEITHPLAHSSYLLNLATPDPQLWKQSIDGLVAELRRAERLGIPYVVLHPGAYTSSSEAAGRRRVIQALNQVHRRTSRLRCSVLLENTAGQGTCLGWRFEQLQSILDGVRNPERLGVCFDTCHAFAAGYGLATQREYRRTMAALHRLVGLSRVKAIHLNDCKRQQGARVDRHAHIGHGQIGLEAFARLLNDRRLRRVPMYLETPKGDHPDEGCSWDEVNLRTLRELIGQRPEAAGPAER